MDLVGIGLEFPAALADTLKDFDQVVSWYGTNRPEFRAEMNCEFLEALPPPDCQLHATDFFLQQVGAPLGSVPKVPLKTPPPPRRRTIVIHPFSGSPLKNWPLDQYQALAEQLPQPVEWLAGPGEKLNTAVRFDNLLDLASWLRGAAAYIGNDSGISHLAAAIGLPTIVLFGPTDPSRWAPRGQVITLSHSNTIASVLNALQQLI